MSVSESKILLVGGTNGFIPMPETAIQPVFGEMVDGIMALFEISETVGINHRYPEQLAVFPNPTTDQIRLKLPSGFSVRANVTIYNLAGQEVLKQENFDAHSPMPLNLPKGIYVVEARNETGTVRGKVVVE